MKRLFIVLLAPALVAALASSICAAPPAPAPEVLLRPDVLPLALDDSIQFRKTSIFLNDPKLEKVTINEMLNFERQIMNYKAITAFDRQNRYGCYYNFYWRARRPANLTLRFEYRQEKLGSYVQAQQLSFNNPKGTIESKFAVIGDAYNDFGGVTSWRALLIENGKIVALNQSFLWD